ncbi:MAG: hypothetical protein AVW06_04740 [Hadesarchaea archaeon DG-33-1]|nr:MAG: hypothetical protein AVW06_04740 [Hadesarchaea archaeon DG-33-1]
MGRDNENTVEFTVTIDNGGVYAVQAGGMSSTLWVALPMVVGTTPENGANSFVDENVVVRFNKSLDASVTPTLTQTSGSLVTYTFSGWSTDNTVATWTHEDWQPYETITLKVSGYKDLTGNVGENYTWSFTTVATPGKPTLISPADGTITTDNMPLFEWECGDNADNNRLLVDNDSDFSSPEENVLLGASENSYTPTTTLSPDNYSWKVIAINAYGGRESSVWTFVVAKWEVEITIENKFQEGEPCTWLTFNVIVKNTGDLVDNYHLTALDGIWPPENIYLDPENLENVLPGENKDSTLWVHIPGWENACTYKEIIVTATSQTDNTVSDNENATIHVIGPSENFYTYLENFYTYLENGWNLVGFIIENTPTNIFTGLSYYTDYYLYYYTPPAGPYGLQGPDQALEDNLGYWVWINRDNTIMTSGTPPDNREIHLVAGWNLVSFPVVNENTTPNNIFPGLSYYTDYYLYWYLAPGGPYQLQGPDEVLKDNLGYWAWINRDNMVTVP